MMGGLSILFKPEINKPPTVKIIISIYLNSPHTVLPFPLVLDFTSRHRELSGINKMEMVLRVLNNL